MDEIWPTLNILSFLYFSRNFKNYIFLSNSKKKSQNFEKHISKNGQKL